MVYLKSSYFHCLDLGTEIKQAIGRFQNFLALPEDKRQKPDFSHLPIEDLQNTMRNAKNSRLGQPFPLLSHLQTHSQSNDIAIFDSEFVLRQYRQFTDNHQTEHTFPFDSTWKECYLWQFKGNSHINIEGDHAYELVEGESIFLTKKVAYGQLTIRTASPEDIVLLVAHKFR